ncbi:MAG: type II toxin-antitoxin system VapC family toxin [Bacteroidota bacterium]|nr:type II toxin-antitoxin system VapC family toxin [Bacteroidota bacterium]
MKPKLYIETTIPSYLVSSLSRDLIVAGHQQITRLWWETRKSDFDIFISQFVINEASGGEESQAEKRLKAIEPFSQLEVTNDVLRLAEAFLSSKVVPKKAATDAAHIAVASVHGMDYLMTWNCAHIANATIFNAVKNICLKEGFPFPIICTPEELMGEES